MDSCGEDFQPWLAPHSQHISVFRSAINDLYPKNSLSVRSRSVKSLCSTTSSARIKLTEQMAELQATMKASAKCYEVEKEELKLRADMEKEQLQLKTRKEEK